MPTYSPHGHQSLTLCRRSKISHDPNNNTWSRDTTNYGHRLLASQGWQPGQTLGAVDAPHAHLHSAASYGHVKVAYRDDNLGLGAKQVNPHTPGEGFGLGGLQDLLGRLNGKGEDAIKKEQQSRADLAIRQYADMKFGGLRFVSGGILVGDKIQKEIDELRAKAQKIKEEESVVSASITTTMAVKEEVVVENEKERKRKKKSKRESSDEEMPDAKETGELQGAERKEKSAETPEERAARKVAKAQRKLERQQLRDARKSAQDGDSTPAATEPSTAQASDSDTPAVSQAVSGTSTPASIGMFGGRHAVRQRYIRQKRMASMDPKALREILMVK
jgi:Pin2-interacting protein X1